ncbi:hypothetical protein FHQ18_04160 [Deferribacter autotrophicus]|uniref:HAMP domain-containing histidine kinase n=1 Tax=Deferribacter autotrophicus TaxID=500465 RepID=A0A5A8F468_9BACT|nr:hypothetical protein [Deferribacter autotrophicus]KAA0258361.1 hypothetical protein FHQ18_04160 [Deferribacter autotrophicus]
MDNWNILKEINNYFLHNIRTQLSIIISGIELLDFDEEFENLRDSISFSAFLLDIYDALMGNLLDILTNKIQAETTLFELSDPVEKLIGMFNSFKSNNVKFILEKKENCKVKLNLYVFKNVIGVLLAECVKESFGEVKIEVDKMSVNLLVDGDKLNSFLFKINNLLEKYNISIYKNGYVKVKVL